MKKLTVCVLLCALLLSLGGITVAAEQLPQGIGFYPGQYAGGDPEQFSPLGDINVDWIPALNGEIDVTDGDLADWYASGAAGTVVTPHNMVSWVGDASSMPVDWKMTSFYAADADYLYFAFDIVDADFTYASSVASYNGDAIQLCLDFGYKMGSMLEQEPYTFISAKNIFYSFSCVADGAPLGIVRQESALDGVLSSTNGDAVKGAARKTDEGWSVELALGWDLLYDDFTWKAWTKDPRVFVGSAQRVPLSMGMSFYYVNRIDNENITWAAGAIKNWTDEAGNPNVSWTVLDNGAMLNLDADYAMQVNCKGVVGVFEEVSMESVMTNEDGSPKESVTPPPDWSWVDTVGEEAESIVESIAAGIDAGIAEDSALEEELDAILEKYGCSTIVGVGSLATLMALAAAAYACRKKD